MRLTTLHALAALVLIATIASAQTARAPAATAPRVAATPAEPSKPLNNNDAQSAAQAMQRNGGSLLKATLAVPVDPGQVPLAQVSYFAVPEPEPRVIKKHDQVTIIIREESEFSSEGTTETMKEAAIDARITEFIKLDLRDVALRGGGIGDNPPSIVADASREFTGEGTVEREDSFTARVTAKVIDVKPNGTLVLEGRKQITTDDEYQRFLVTGIARAEDVSADNTILSTQLADFNLRKTHKGNVRNATKKGFIPKLLDVINPF
ncbi:MAG TPA: flagellar basal body L-ring protein FlgH [Tepidisphaeraceae bacterium]|nr:flagellar basal body L-ring protein FlgH [Tepidisphaeraceae bacterium]